MSIFNLLPFLFFDGEGAGAGGGDGDGEGTGEGEGAAGKDKWLETIPESVREWDEVKNSETPEKFWEQVTNMRTFLGQSIRIPSAEAGKESWGEFNQKLQAKVPGLMPVPDADDSTAIDAVLAKLGKPEKHEDYTIPEIDPQGQIVDLTVYESLKPIAHKHGLTKNQYQGVIKDFAEAQLVDVVAQNKEATTKREELFKTWGATKDTKLATIVSLIEKTQAPAELGQLVVKGRLDAASLDWLDRIATQFGGSEGVNLLDDKSGGKSNVMTPLEAQGLIDDIMDNRDHAYWKAAHPGHKAALDRMLQLQKFAHPEASTDPNSLRGGPVQVAG